MTNAASISFLDAFRDLNPAPPAGWSTLPTFQKLRVFARARLMANGLAWTERAGLAARNMPELSFLRRLIRPGGVAADVGANIGVVASEIARHAARTLAFEPNPMAYYVLRHLKRPGLTATWSAVGARGGGADLCVPRGRKGISSNGGHFHDSHDRPSDAIFRVPVLTLDSLRLDTLDFLKIDVEGHEPQVLDGAVETLRRCRPTIMVEHEVSHVGAAFGDVFARLAAWGFEGFFLQSGGLRHLSAFDPARMQGPDSCKAQGSYVSNFIFLPRGRRAADRQP
jgi:FkbM family methyltransferase